MKRAVRLVLMVIMLLAMSASTAFAAGWVNGQGDNAGRWWYDLGDGQYYAGSEATPSWQWIDGNLDGLAECYAFDQNGWMYADTTTPDGYQVNENGAWTETGVVQTQAVGVQTQTEPAAEGNSLVVYFSRTGTTEAAARRIQELTGSVLVELEPVNAYPSSYDAVLNQAERELDQNARPALATAITGMEQYDTVYVGYPIWWGTEPKLIDTFLETYDLSGKTVVPFCTSGSSGIGTSMRSIRSLCPDSSVLEGRRIGSTGEIEGWLKGLGLIR